MFSHESTPDSDVIGSRNETSGAYHDVTIGSKKVMYSFSSTCLSLEALAESSELAFGAGASTEEGRLVRGRLERGARPNAATLGSTAASAVKKARHLIVAVAGGQGQVSSDLSKSNMGSASWRRTAVYSDEETNETKNRSSGGVV